MKQGVAALAAVYFVPLEAGMQADTKAQLLTRVTKQQRDNVVALAGAADRKRRLLGMLLARCLASEWLTLPNSALHFAVGEHGKPFVQAAPAFEYNLSHTDNALAAAVAGAPVGVDVERVRAANPKIAARFFAVGEQAYFAAGGHTDHRFFEVWTRKEAWLKREGIGLAATLAAVDTTAPPLKEEIATFHLGSYILSCSCNYLAAPQTVHQLSEQELIHRALQLEPVE